jgi:spore maturation protein CgeB
MKILYLGDIGPGQTCLMRMRALERLKHQILGVNTVAPWRNASWLQRQTQRRFHRGSVVNEINRLVLAEAREFKPDLIWADKQEFLRIETLHELRKLGPRLLHFTPDPYFTLTWKRTPLMDESVGAFDILVYCKSYEREEYEALNQQTIYMPLGYCDKTHRPFPSSDPKWQCDLGFLGGWEPRREEFLSPIVEANIDLKIWGGYWDFLKDGKWTLRRKIILDQLAGGVPYNIHFHPELAARWQGGEVYGDDYARALSGAKIGLGFLRKVCPDQHTTRTFEIPACGSMLLADRTPEHQEFFEEGKEADFFDSKEELTEKVRFYTTNERARADLASKGRQRCVDGRYAYVHRMADALAEMGLGC